MDTTGGDNKKCNNSEESDAVRDYKQVGNVDYVPKTFVVNVNSNNFTLNQHVVHNGKLEQTTANDNNFSDEDEEENLILSDGSETNSTDPIDISLNNDHYLFKKPETMRSYNSKFRRSELQFIKICKHMRSLNPNTEFWFKSIIDGLQKIKALPLCEIMLIRNYTDVIFINTLRSYGYLIYDKKVVALCEHNRYANTIRLLAEQVIINSCRVLNYQPNEHFPTFLTRSATSFFNFAMGTTDVDRNTITEGIYRMFYKHGSEFLKKKGALQNN